jgi:predicted phage terminase large subunit-like protein
MATQTADEWQTNLVRSPGQRTLLCCSRSAGKSSASAALALSEAVSSPGSLALILSPSERQSGETMLKVLSYYAAARRPVATAKETGLELRLANGSRVVALPGTERTVRTYNSVTLLIIDEAARVEDELYKAVRPMLAVRDGRLLALSTPFGRTGWFYEAWQGKDGGAWDRLKVTARDVPRISPAFLEQERKSLGELWFRQEYLCDFLALEGAEWPPEYFEDASGSPLWFDTWPGGLVSRTLALDPSKGKDSKKGDYAALVELACDRQGLLWCEADLVRGRSAEWVADWTVDRAARFRPDVAGVESNQFLQLFAVLIAQSASRRGRTLPLVEIHNHAPKLVRIRRLGPYLCQRRIRFRDTPGTRLLVEQLREFPEGEHDDAPDACEMSLRLMEGLWVGAHEDQEDETVYRA